MKRMIVSFFFLAMVFTSCNINNKEIIEREVQIATTTISPTVTSEFVTQEPTTPATEEIDPKDYTGIWHQSDCVPAGYAERYRFNSDGTFIFEKSQMDGASREIAMAGKWETVNGKLILTIKNKIICEEGNPVPPYLGYGSEYVLEGGINKFVSLAAHDYETKVYEISDVAIAGPDDLRRTVFIDGERYWDYTGYDDMFDYYNHMSSYTDTFDYNAYKGGGTVYQYNQAAKGELIINLPSVTVDGIKYYVQEAEADLNGDTNLEKIKIYYKVYDVSNKGEELLSDIRITVDSGTMHDQLAFYTSGLKEGVYFADFNNNDKYLEFCFSAESVTHILCFTDEGKIKYRSILGDIESYDGKGKIYTEYNCILDTDKTLMSYFDMEKGLIPFEKGEVIGKEISFSCGIIILKEPNHWPDDHLFQQGDLEMDFSRDRLLTEYGDNVLTEILPDEKLTILDFYYKLDGERYEIAPWLKVKTEDGKQGWLRIIPMN